MAQGDLEQSPRRPLNPLHWIACFEAFKGLMVVLTGVGLLSLLHRDVLGIAHDFINALHISASHHLTDVFLKLADNLNDAKLWQFASFAFLYAAVRFIEAYGLWRDRRWAEWFAVLSGGVYVPIELYEMVMHFSVVKLAVFLFNLAIVAYLFYNLQRKLNLKSNQHTIR